jgi:hypothetical protein
LQEDKLVVSYMIYMIYIIESDDFVSNTVTFFKNINNIFLNREILKMCLSKISLKNVAKEIAKIIGKKLSIVCDMK